MKKVALLLLLVFAGAVRADDGVDAPEFFFTRLAYSESPNGCCRHRTRGFVQPTMPIPARKYVCPEFGGTGFFPQQGWGWATDYPGGDCKFMGGIHRLTGMRGGFLHVDDFWGRQERENFFAQMKKVFPDRQLELIPLNHEIFHTFFDVDKLIQVPGQGAGCYGDPTWEVSDEKDPRIYGIADDTGRLMVVATYNSDLGDAWEYMDAACYPEEYSGQAYRLGMNFMIYALTH